MKHIGEAYIVDPETQCWIAIRIPHANGYTSIRVDGKFKATHRVMYERKFGVVPVGLELDHLCRNRRCINPDHLEPVTRTENVRRGAKCCLTLEDAQYIRELNRAGFSHRRLAYMYNVAKHTVTAVLSGRTWRVS